MAFGVVAGSLALLRMTGRKRGPEIDRATTLFEILAVTAEADWHYAKVGIG